MTDYTVKEATAGQLGPPFNTPAAANLVTWPRSYRSYASHHSLNTALAGVAESGVLQSLVGIEAHATTFQPYSKPDAKGNEDKHTVQFWELPSGTWTFAAIFDGM